MSFKLVGAGREKDVYAVSDTEVWALNRENSEELRTALASWCIHQILHELFPNNFPEIKSVEQVVEDTQDGITKRILRTTERIPGKTLNKLLSRFYQESINAFSDMLEAVGAGSVLDPVPQNFIRRKRDGKSELVYLDTLNPFTLNAQDQPDKRTVDTAKLKTTIETTFKDDEKKKSKLLTLLTKYEELTPNMETAPPQSYWRNK